jgi:hypothetical protein
MLAAHLPYPALVLDAHTNVVLTNPACAVLFGAEPTGRNFVRDFLANPQAAELVDNWPQVASARLDRRSRFTSRGVPRPRGSTRYCRTRWPERVSPPV